jgi:hypothetical protein
VDCHVRTAEQIVAALFRDRTVAQPEERPEPCGKHYRGYFAELPEPGEEPVPSAYRTWCWLAGQVERRWQSGQPIVRLMDGQPVLWEAADACLGDFHQAKRGEGEKVIDVEILDIMHAATYVWKAAKALYGHKEHQEAFTHDRLLKILRGEVTGVVRGIRRMASQRNLTWKAQGEISKACNYLENNAHRMRYDEYLEAGYPQGPRIKGYPNWRWQPALLRENRDLRRHSTVCTRDSASTDDVSASSRRAFAAGLSFGHRFAS